MTRRKTWSYSALETYEQCAAKYHYRYIARVPTPPPADDDPRERGDRMHKEIEAYLLGTAPLHDRFSRFKDYIDELRGPGLVVEQMRGLTREWVPCAPDAPNAWLRYKLDARVPTDTPHTYRVIDWKTGKKYIDKHRDQGNLYAVSAVFAECPDADVAQVEFVYLDQREADIRQVPRENAPLIRANFERRVDLMHGAQKWSSNPTRLCGWCDYSKAKGGPCPYDGKK